MLGADFTLWFWLVASIITLVVVPTRAGVLRLKTARDALTLPLPRAELLARLPRAVRTLHRRGHLDAARRAVDRAFRDRPGRRVVLVIDARYAAAAAVLRDALAQLEVDLEPVSAADPVATPRGRAPRQAHGWSDLS